MSITPAPQVEMVSELPELPLAVAFCDLNDTRSAFAFGWAGTGRRPWHNAPIYTADQMRAYAQAALNARAGGDAKDAERYRFLRDGDGEQYWQDAMTAMESAFVSTHIDLLVDEAMTKHAALASQAVGAG